MIGNKMTRADLIGRKCRFERNLRNGGGQCVSIGTVCTITDVIRGHGIIVTTTKCPHCGQSAYITHVSRNDLSLLADDKCETTITKEVEAHGN